MDDDTALLDIIKEEASKKGVTFMVYMNYLIKKHKKQLEDAIRKDLIAYVTNK